jgi:tRNA 2-thiouridine synthesizing protein A
MPERGRPADGPDLNAPQAMLDAGGATGGALTLALRRGLRNLAAGQILEIVAREPAARLDIAAWCRLTGHELLQTVCEDEATRLWIRKR